MVMWAGRHLVFSGSAHKADWQVDLRTCGLGAAFSHVPRRQERKRIQFGNSILEVLKDISSLCLMIFPKEAVLLARLPSVAIHSY